MKFAKFDLLAWLRMLVAALALAPFAAHSAVEEVSDEALSEVSGAQGIEIQLHLELNLKSQTEVDISKMTSISLGFFDASKTQNTYLVFQGFGGIFDLWGLGIDAQAGPAGVGDVVNVTLPSLVTFKDFGLRALYATTDLNVQPTASYGKWILNGAATVTGNVYIWPAK